MSARWSFFPVREFAAHQDQWQQINLAGPASALLDPAFLLPSIDAFADGRELLALCGDPAAPDAMAILHNVAAGRWETFQPAQNPIGCWLQRPGMETDALLDSLLSALPGFALAVGITQQDPDFLPRPADDARSSTLDYIRTARITLDRTFEQFWEARGKNLKQNIKKQRNRLEKDGVKVALEVTTAPGDIAQAIADYGELEGAGWKAQEGTAILADNAQGRFYRRMLEGFCRRGRGRVYRYRFNDRVVAMDLCVEDDASLIILKTTHDESLKAFSPAFLMRHEAFRTLFDERRIKRIEFYGKLMEWHTRWSDEVRTMYHVSRYRWAMLPRLRRLLGSAPGEPGAAPAAAVTVYENLSALPERYETLFAEAGKASLFSTLPWFRNFIQSGLAPSERQRIYAVDTTGNAPVARAVLLMRCLESGAGMLGARTLVGLSNYYTSLFGPIIDARAPDTQSTLDALASAIAGDASRWDVVDLHPLPADGSEFSRLIAAFERAGLLVQTYFCFGNWYLQVAGRSYAEYFASLPSQLRNTITRKKRQFEKSAGSRIAVYRDEADLAEGIRAYEQIYAASWKSPEPFPDFIAGLCQVCARSGWLRLGVAYVDGQPAAAQIWIVNAGIASIYKLAYDERHARLSLGTVLAAHLMEQVIDVDKVHQVDYLTGDDAYKKDWMSHRRERWGIVAFNLRTLKGVLAALRHLVARMARSVVNAVRGVG